MSGLDVFGLAKTYGARRAVDHFTHHFVEGRITTIVGPSGSGKTTLLWMIAGLTPPDEGAVHVDGKDITAQVPERRGFGLVFQNYALFPHLTVRENVEFGLRVRGIGRAERARRALATLDKVRIRSLADRPIHQISGGEQQRVALARALAFQPRVLLMDEPLSALDARLRDALRAELFTLLQGLRITTVYVTHDQIEAMSLGHELIVMNEGRLEQVGAPQSIYRCPANPFVAQFLGTANLFEARCVEDRAGRVLHLPFATLRVEQAIPAGAGWVMIRPEDIGPADGSDIHFQGTVESFVFLGNQIRLTLRSKDSRLIVDVANEIRIDSGAAFPARIELSKLCWIPQESERLGIAE